MKASCAIAVALVGATAIAAAPTSWEAIFSAEGAPAVHARVRYVDARGGEHRLELWRTAKALRRDTDGKLSLVVERRPGGDDAYHVVHREGDRAYDVSRDALYRIGSFPQWAQLATMLTRPGGDVRVVAKERATTAAGACRWYEVATANATERICWSASLRLPLVVERDATRVVTVEHVDTAAIARNTFTVDAGVRRVDVDQDLD